MDLAGRAISGALVENVDSQGAAASTVSNEAGRYELQVPLSGSVTVRVSKEGYASYVSTVNLPRTSPTDFNLRFTGQSVDLTGAYTVTFTADAACTQLPGFLRTRTYSASISQGWFPNDYSGTLSGAQFRYNEFEASVAGRFASFFTLGDGFEAIIAERITDSTSLWIDFWAGNAPVDEPSFTIPMYGTFAYCGDDDFIRGNAACLVPRITCTSSNHTLTMTRR